MARRRWLQFSLRGFFVLLTALAVWLGIVIVPAREQREAVKAIHMAGGVVIYDWQGDPSRWKRLGDCYLEPNEGRDGNRLLTHLFGEETFQDVYAVVLNRRANAWNDNPRARRPPDATQWSSIMIDSSTMGRDADSWVEDVRSIIPTMQRLPKLKKVFLEGTAAQSLHKAIASALPHCEIVLHSGLTALAPGDPVHRYRDR